VSSGQRLEPLKSPGQSSISSSKKLEPIKRLRHISDPEHILNDSNVPADIKLRPRLRSTEPATKELSEGRPSYEEATKSPAIPVSESEEKVAFPRVASEFKRGSQQTTANLTWSNLCVTMPKKSKCCGLIKEKEPSPYDFHESQKIQNLPRKSIVENGNFRISPNP